MIEATTVNMTSQRPSGKVIKKSLTYANPNASDNNIARFIKGLANLSNNTLKDIEKVQKSNIDFSLD
ncbi:MAG: hypothetical protein IJT73_00600 [Selenomonadaceae bacterium]|nr:hypothetical protein [Selenomonadaceae bacterium]